MVVLTEAGVADDALMEGVVVVIITEAGEADDALMGGVVIVVVTEACKACNFIIYLTWGEKKCITL